MALETTAIEEEKNESTAKELQFTINDYNEPEEKSGLLAAATKIMNLLFLKPYTYPDTPEMGVDLEQYMFEYQTEGIRGEIERNINQQISTYLPDLEMITTVVRFIDDKESQTVNLGIGFSLYVDGQQKDFVAFFSGDKSRRISSSIIY